MVIVEEEDSECLGHSAFRTLGSSVRSAKLACSELISTALGGFPS
jgi:hypothetical protein